MSDEKLVVIGIAGPSQGGKSTLALRLAEKLDCELNVVLLDMLFNFDNVPTTTNYLGETMDDIECPEAIDWDLLLNHEEWGFHARKKNAKTYVIVEGFLLFYKPEISNLCDIKFWIECEKSDGCKRRVRGNMDNIVGVNYYNRNVWGNFEKFKSTQLKNAGEDVIKFNSSEMGKEEIFNQALKEVLTERSKKIIIEKESKTKE